MIRIPDRSNAFLVAAEFISAWRLWSRIRPSSHGACAPTQGEDTRFATTGSLHSCFPGFRMRGGSAAKDFVWRSIASLWMTRNGSAIPEVSAGKGATDPLARAEAPYIRGGQQSNQFRAGSAV